MFACSYKGVSQKTHELMRVTPLCLSVGNVSPKSRPAASVSRLFAEAASSEQMAAGAGPPHLAPLLPLRRLPADLLGRQWVQLIPAPGPYCSASLTACASARAEGVCQLLCSCSMAAKAVLETLQSLPEY